MMGGKKHRARSVQEDTESLRVQHDGKYRVRTDTHPAWALQHGTARHDGIL